MVAAIVVAWSTLGLTYVTDAHTLRWASEFSQRENCHQLDSADGFHRAC